jgi:hypothetical protein
MNAGKEAKPNTFVPTETIKVISIKKHILDPIKSSVAELTIAFDDINDKLKYKDDVKTTFTNLWKMVKLHPIQWINTSEVSFTEILIRNILAISQPLYTSLPLIQYSAKSIS